MPTRRMFLAGAGGLATGLLTPCSFASAGPSADFDVRRYGAKGDGRALDTAAVQRAIDAASARGGGRVLLPGGRRFLSGALMLKSRVELHLADDTVLLASTDPADYGPNPGLLNSDGAHGVTISGAGFIDGQAMKFMTTYSETDMRWEPMRFRPRMFSLVRTHDLEIRGITFGHSPNWGLHMLGCERVLVDGIKIRNELDVPNCDGIDPDHCRDVEIRNCDIVCADDGIVVKTSDQQEDYGITHNITVRDCVVTTRDSGIKVGTETFADISKVLFERCKILSGGRGPTITHRQPGNIEDIEFRDIEVSSEHHAARWWGWGEPICLSARPRSATGKVGSLKNVRLRNIRGRGENSVRLDGQKDQPIEDILLEGIDITIDRWTKFPGGRFDNRPEQPALDGLEVHDTPVFSLRNLKKVTMRNCTARWGSNRQPYFSNALQVENVAGLKLEHFTGEAAFPDRQKAIRITPA